MFKINKVSIVRDMPELLALPQGKVLINTINAHSYNIAQKDLFFAEALKNGDALIPDGISILKAYRWKHWKNAPKERISGADLFAMEMKRLNDNGGKCFFLGSSEVVLELICKRARMDYPNIQVVVYSPPYKSEFSDDENKKMIDAVNKENPDLLWIGMTAPKQEKWAYKHWNELNINCHCGTIGAVFDFYAGTVARAPLWWQQHGFEWLYRLMKEPRRMWKRYIIGNALFLWDILEEK